MKFKLWLENEMLQYLLSPAGQTSQIGPEENLGGDTKNGAVKYVSPHGSYRYIYMVDGQAVSALQVVSRDGTNAQIANVYTMPDVRRQGYARQLLQLAQQDFDTVVHSDHIGELGKAWRDNV